MPLTQDQAQFLSDPSAWQALYNKAYGLPDVGRSPYQNWQAGQWRAPATEYSLAQAGIGATPDADLTFSQYLDNRRAGIASFRPILSPPLDAQLGVPQRGISNIAPGYFSALTAMSPTDQRAKLDLLPNYVGQNAFLGALEAKYPSWLARGLAGQAFSGPVQQAFNISTGALAGDSFFDYLRTRYDIGR